MIKSTVIVTNSSIKEGPLGWPHCIRLLPRALSSAAECVRTDAYQLQVYKPTASFISFTVIQFE